MLSKVPTTKNLGLRFASDAKRFQLKNPIYNAFGAPRPSNVEKPISPHTTIYKFPLPAITSIITRFTGVGLSLGELKKKKIEFKRLIANCLICLFVSYLSHIH